MRGDWPSYGGIAVSSANRHTEANRWPAVDYNVVQVGETWFRSAPNFREVIASTNPVAQAFALPS